MARRWPFPRNTITASVSVADTDKRMAFMPSSRLSKDAFWQREAWGYYHGLGEVRNAANYVASNLSRCSFFVGTRDHPGDPVIPIDDDDSSDLLAVRDQLNRIRGRDGTLSALVKVYGVQQFIAGEGWLVAQDGLDGERWEFISTSEKRRLDHIGRKVAEGATNPWPDASLIDPGALVIRMWQRDAEWRERATSSLRAVLDLCEALRTAHASMVAGDRSRLATAGLLFVPAEGDLPKSPAHNDVGAAQRLQLLDDLMDAMEAAMSDPASASAIVPILVEMKHDMIEKVKRITFEREVDKTIIARIEHLLQRLAQGLELPVEKFLGITSLNHWGAWQVQEELISNYIAPMADAFCQDLTTGFLVPSLTALAANGIVASRPIDEFAVGFDTTDLNISTNKADNALALYDRLLLGEDPTLDALGFDPDNKPEQSEIDRHLLWAQILAGKAAAPGAKPMPVAALPPGTSPPNEALPADDAEPVDENDAKAPGAPKDGTPGGAKKGPGGVKKGPPAGGAPDQGETPPSDVTGKPKKASSGSKASKAKTASAYTMAGRIAAACELAVEGAVARAGETLRDRVASMDLAHDVAGHDPIEIPALLGAGRVEQLGYPADTLIAGTSFAPLRQRIVTALGEHVADRIVHGVELLAHARMYDPDLDVFGAIAVLCEAAVEPLEDVDVDD